MRGRRRTRWSVLGWMGRRRMFRFGFEEREHGVLWIVAMTRYLVSVRLESRLV